MLRSGGDQIDAGGLDAAVTQDICQLRHIPADPVKGSGKQVPQVVREHLAGLYLRPDTQGFHLRPDLLSGHTSAASGEKDLTGGDFLPRCIPHQLPAELSRQQNGADLALHPNFCFALLNCFDCEIPHFTDPDAGGADGFQQKSQALPP